MRIDQSTSRSEIVLVLELVLVLEFLLLPCRRQYVFSASKHLAFRGLDSAATEDSLNAFFYPHLPRRANRGLEQQ
jgi:hypothetical protein